MIKHVQGDLFDHIPEDKNGKVFFIPQVCNNIQVWGSGVVIPIKKRWPQSYVNHKQWKSPLGMTEFDNVEEGVWLINMIAQDGIGERVNNRPIGKRPLRYEHLVKCMIEVRETLQDTFTIEDNKKEFLCCQFGGKRAGGNWEFIEDLIEEIWGDFNITIFEYEEK